MADGGKSAFLVLQTLENAFQTAVFVRFDNSTTRRSRTATALQFRQSRFAAVQKHCEYWCRAVRSKSRDLSDYG